MSLSQTTRLLLIVGLFWYAQYVYMPNTAPFLLAQKVSADFVGIVVGAYGFTQMAARFGIGLISDVLGKYKIIIVAGCLFAAVSSIVRIVIPTGPGFLVANLMSGLASSTWLCFMLLYTSSVAGGNMLQALGYIFAANNLGIMLSFITSALLYQYLGMSFLCALSVAAGSVACLLALGLKDITAATTPAASTPNNTSSANNTSSTSSANSTSNASSTSNANSTSNASSTNSARPRLSELVRVVFNGRIWFFAFLATIQQGVTMGTVMSFSQEIARQSGGSSFEMGLMTIVFIAFCVVSSYLVAKPFIARLSPGLIMGVTLVLLGLYCFASGVASNVYLLIALQVLLGLSLGFVLTVSNSEALKGIAPRHKSSALGLFQAIFAAGMTFVPMIAGFIIDASGSYASAFAFQGLLCLTGALLVTIYYLRVRQLKLRAHAPTPK